MEAEDVATSRLTEDFPHGDSPYPQKQTSLNNKLINGSLYFSSFVTQFAERPARCCGFHSCFVVRRYRVRMSVRVSCIIKLCFSLVSLVPTNWCWDDKFTLNMPRCHPSASVEQHRVRVSPHSCLSSYAHPTTCTCYSSALCYSAVAL